VLFGYLVVEQPRGGAALATLPPPTGDWFSRESTTVLDFLCEIAVDDAERDRQGRGPYGAPAASG
jgi:hypothetical protein